MHPNKHKALRSWLRITKRANLKGFTKGQVSWVKILTWKILLGVWSNVCQNNRNVIVDIEFRFLCKNWTKHQVSTSNSVSYLKWLDFYHYTDESQSTSKTYCWQTLSISIGICIVEGLRVCVMEKTTYLFTLVPR